MPKTQGKVVVRVVGTKISRTITGIQTATSITKARVGKVATTKSEWSVAIPNKTPPALKNSDYSFIYENS